MVCGLRNKTCSIFYIVFLSIKKNIGIKYNTIMTDRGRRDAYEPTGDEGKSRNSENAEAIAMEVERLSKKGTPTAADVLELYKKYSNNDAIVDEILKLRAKRYNKMKRHAKKIAEKIYRKYSEGTRPLHEILDRMMKYKNDNKWTDAEYDEFRKELTALLTGQRAMEVDVNQNLVAYRSRINRVLGGIESRNVQEPGLNISDAERPVLDEILGMAETYSNLHKQVFMNSLTYEDCSIVAMTGEYKRERHIASNYIHPVIAALFLPKFDIFETNMLYSNFGEIVKARSERKPIVTEPNALLLHNITTDPNDVVCDTKSPLADIRNRYRVQIELWQTVLKLRSGQYYEATPVSDFIKQLNNCRNNLYDNADLAYNQDEGSVLRRLLSVFSLRPTVIYTKPVYSIASFAAGPLAANMAVGGDINQALAGFQNQPVYTITQIPMITLNIPPYQYGVSGEQEPKDIRAATSQTIWINENKMIIPKEQTIIYSNEVLIFYVNRRYHRINIKTLSNPIAFSQLPLTMSSFERLNSYPVHVPDRLSLKRAEETYHLRSVVSITETQIKQGNNMTNIITGNNALIMSHRNLDRGVFEPNYYLYDPFGASLPVRHPEAANDPTKDGYFTNKPISRIEPVFTAPPELTGGVENPSFFDRASRAGTIFIYQKPTQAVNQFVVSV